MLQLQTQKPFRSPAAAARHGRRPPVRTLVRVLAMAGVVSFVTTAGLPPAAAQGLPSGMNVVHGQASAVVKGNQMTVTNSANAVLNWQAFSIGAGNQVRFDQPAATSRVLNRVVGNDASSIFGSISSNGQVWLVNPRGVLFGRDARIDVGSLVVSTLNLPRRTGSTAAVPCRCPAWQAPAPSPSSTRVSCGRQRRPHLAAGRLGRRAQRGPHRRARRPGGAGRRPQRRSRRRAAAECRRAHQRPRRRGAEPGQRDGRRRSRRPAVGGGQPERHRAGRPPRRQGWCGAAGGGRIAATGGGQHHQRRRRRRRPRAAGRRAAGHPARRGFRAGRGRRRPGRRGADAGPPGRAHRRRHGGCIRLRRRWAGVRRRRSAGQGCDPAQCRGRLLRPRGNHSRRRHRQRRRRPRRPVERPGHARLRQPECARRPARR